MTATRIPRIPPPKQLDKGLRFGRLVVLNPAGSLRLGRRNIMFRVSVCQCDCGEMVIVPDTALKNGSNKSCGCLYRESQLSGDKRRVHGRAQSKIYWRWSAMIQRCYNPSTPNYADYGGRGITVCPQWLDSFAAFLADMGEPPFPRAQLDRINNNGNYEPGNVRWADKRLQMLNRRNGLGLRDVNDDRISLKEAAHHLALSPETFLEMLGHGLS